ncbi:putative metal-dependent hydrolase YfiT [Adhaeribacter aerolatus]|uniref:Putative metal-dependent hydrolase YfiT n=1 Tax=Adhaeribacter aerolatus TaxID=670289 RepID=A0A512B5F5_9BACT|nr:DinB family protein [Adhaeribacter aerolatus]GEO07190.1 putative metal-dependent hydrolase YfiT [Adhaeribacter aerolatus]
MEHLQYPIGRFQPQTDYTAAEINFMINFLEQAPAKFAQPLINLSEADYEKTYRPGSWTIRQLVHHVADIHLLNFLRLKKALTEENFQFTTILMDDWARTPDAAQAPIQDSLAMLSAITPRFVFLMRTLDEKTLSGSFYHPVRKIYLSLKQFFYMATWHIAHHQGHIALALGLEPQPFKLR